MSEKVDLLAEKELVRICKLVEDPSSSQTVREVIRERVRYEYSLKRYGVRKCDFLKAIKVEKEIETKLATPGCLSKKNAKRIVSSKIISLYQRFLEKFPNDAGLWLDFLEFASKNQADGLCHNIFQRASRLCPLHWGIYIAYSRWLYEKRQDLASSRQILRAALRIDPSCVAIMAAILRLEIDVELANHGSGTLPKCTLEQIVQIFLMRQKDDIVVKLMTELSSIVEEYPSFSSRSAFLEILRNSSSPSKLSDKPIDKNKSE